MEDQLKTTLIQKDTLKWTIPNKYIPITYLQIMWKILTHNLESRLTNG